MKQANKAEATKTGTEHLNRQKAEVETKDFTEPAVNLTIPVEAKIRTISVDEDINKLDVKLTDLASRVTELENSRSSASIEGKIRTLFEEIENLQTAIAVINGKFK